MVYTRFINVATGHIIQPGGLQVGDLFPTPYFVFHIKVDTVHSR